MMLERGILSEHGSRGSSMVKGRRIGALCNLVTLIGMLGTQVFWGINPHAPVKG